MRRAFFLALGICLILFGLECLALERAVISTGGFGEAGGVKEFIPPDWSAWTLLSAGAIVILWTFSIPRRMAG